MQTRCMVLHVRWCSISCLNKDAVFLYLCFQSAISSLSAVMDLSVRIMSWWTVQRAFIKHQISVSSTGFLPDHKNRKTVCSTWPDTADTHGTVFLRLSTLSAGNACGTTVKVCFWHDKIYSHKTLVISVFSIKTSESESAFKTPCW